MEQVVSAAMSKLWENGDISQFFLFGFLFWQVRGIRFEMKKMNENIGAELQDGKKRFAKNEADIAELKKQVHQLQTEGV